MTDFLGRLELQLIAAERKLSTPATVTRPHWWTSRKHLAVALAALLVASSAVATTRPWEPVLGRPGLHDTPRGTSSTRVPADATAILAVLRRPQTNADRGVVAQHLLRGVGQEFRGVRLGSVRTVTLTPGHHALVLSATGVGGYPDAAPGIDEPVCLVFSGGGLCGDAQSLRRRGITLIAGPRILGLVPDGVAKVVTRFSSGRDQTAEVHDNVFEVANAPTTSRPSAMPKGLGNRRVSPHRVTVPFHISWIGADGHLIGPASHP